MLLSINGLTGLGLAATDGEIGKVTGFYFDDYAWTIRYLVVQTGRWLGRRVLISPSVVGHPDAPHGVLPVQLSRDQVRESPDVDTDKPVSRQLEETIAGHYGWPVWYVLPGAPVPMPPVSAPSADPASYDPHLRSTGEVTGYHIRARDGEIGHVEDFVLDDGEWCIRYLVVDTKNWLPGRKVLVLPSLIQKIDWAASEVHLDLTRERIERSPEFHPAEPVNRAYEEQLVDYYGRPAYWQA